MDRAAFLESVGDALGRLDDLSGLARHPLGRFLSGDGSQLPAGLLRTRLLQEIEQVRPRLGVSLTSPAWRHYRYLELRYLQGESHEATAHRMGLSLRQAHRVRLAALDELATSLRETCAGETSSAAGRLAHPQAWPARESAAAPRATLDDELARLTRGPVDAPADLVEEVRSALEVIAPLVSSRGVAMDVDTPPGRLPVAIRRALLRQMVILLLSYSLEQWREGRLLVSVGAAGDEPVLDVVFAARARAGAETLATTPTMPATTPEDSRLAALRQLAAAAGGCLRELSVGGGRCLRLSLRPHRPATVLVVDDNPDLICLFQLYLRGTRYRVVEASNGQSALRAAAQDRPDVVTLDVMMPLEDGWEIFRQLRQDPTTREIPVVVCSILPEKDLALSLGAAGFLAKPVTAQTLIGALDHCLESPRAASRDSASGSP